MKKMPNLRLNSTSEKRDNIKNVKFSNTNGLKILYMNARSIIKHAQDLKIIFLGVQDRHNMHHRNMG